jgi:peroxiredoxin family protein
MTTTTMDTTDSTDTSQTTIAEAANIDVNTLLERMRVLEQRVAELESAPAQDLENQVSLVVFSGDMDRAIASFIIATGAAAMGMEVSMFFTFWGLNIVKKQKVYTGKNVIEKGFTAMLPAGTKNLGLSQMNFFGAGAAIMRKLMQDHAVSSLEELVQMTQELGVRMTVCDMSRELLGVRDEELMDGLEFGGVATFLGDAARSKAALFI